jgi:putative colanic acid biosynthesis UDP-glucose lipid carrier transferase
MLPRRLGLLRLASHLCGLACLAAAFSAALWLRFSSGFFEIRDAPHLPSYGAYLFFAAACWSLLARHGRVDERIWQGESLAAYCGAVVRAAAGALAIVSLLAFFYRGYSFSRLMIALFWTLHVALVWLLGIVLAQARLRLAKERGAARMLVLGSGAFAETAAASLQASGVAGGAVTVLNPGAGWSERLLAGEWDEVVVALPLAEHDRLPPLLETLRASPAPVRVALDLPAAQVHTFGGLPMLDLGGSPSDSLAYSVSKRAFDIALASLMLLLGAPLAAIVAAAIKLSSPGPVFFFQTRVGTNGRSFRMVKFRTLPVRPAATSDREWIAVPTRLGAWLRRWRIDEWPQFWNVLRGDMSVVGPRPERAHFADGFRAVLREYGLRHRLKAGITGWAQVHGLTGDTEIARRLEYDLYYLRNWSLALDLRIIAMTVLRPFRG